MGEKKEGQACEDPFSIPRSSPLSSLCVCAEENEFILYAMRKSIHRYDLTSGDTEQLPLTGLRAAVALDFDYERNCLYWSDLALDIIQVRPLWVCSGGAVPCDCPALVSFFQSGLRRCVLEVLKSLLLSGPTDDTFQFSVLVCSFPTYLCPCRKDRGSPQSAVLLISEASLYLLGRF